jgi:hypothetical protein
VSLTSVVDGEALLAEDGEEVLEAGDNFENGCYVVALIVEIAFCRTNWSMLV